MTRPTYVLGVYIGHDAGACLLRDGEIVVMIEEERLSRFKHARPDAIGRLWPRFVGRQGYFPWAAVTYCLNAEGIGLDDLDVLALPAEWSGEGIRNFLPLKDRSRIVLATEPTGGAHHFRHALSTFFASPFDDTAVLVVDDDGSVVGGQYEAESGYHFTDRRGAWSAVFKNRYGNQETVRRGLGWTYHAVSNMLGFANPHMDVAEAGKTMGLAPYGGPVASLAEPWIRTSGTTLDFSGFRRWVTEQGHIPSAYQLPGSRPLDATTSFAANLAWKVQHETEEAMIALAIALRERTGARHLCLAGGVALNSVANARIAKEAGFEDVFVQPAAGDGGQAIGLAYYGHLHLQRTRSLTDIQPIRHAYGGRTYPSEAIGHLLEASGLRHTHFASAEEAATHAGKALADGAIVGWMQGGSEYGPRALGHRSILTDPRGADRKDTLNARVKFREGFRPFAPSVLAERAEEVFALPVDSPYMLQVVPVRPEWAERLPAVTHVDGTARVQTVDAESAPLYHRLIESFAEESGTPVVLNTSFNLRGMPIVESPFDALHCFLYTAIDALYVGPYRVEAPTPSEVSPRLAQGWTLSMRSHPEPGTVELVATSARREVSHAVPTTHAHALHRADGSHTVTELLAEDDAALWRTAQVWLREGVLHLDLESLTFPIALGPDARLPEDADRLIDDAGLLSARHIDV